MKENKSTGETSKEIKYSVFEEAGPFPEGIKLNPVNAGDAMFHRMVAEGAKKFQPKDLDRNIHIQASEKGVDLINKMLQEDAAKLTTEQNDGLYRGYSVDINMCARLNYNMEQNSSFGLYINEVPVGTLEKPDNMSDEDWDQLVQEIVEGYEEPREDQLPSDENNSEGLGDRNS